VRLDRDESLTRAVGLSGLPRAWVLDKALNLLQANIRADYHEIAAEICELDRSDEAGLRSKYLPEVVAKRRVDVQEAIRKQDWDGTILKIDKIIEELKPTGKLAGDIYIDRARAKAKLGHWDESETDYVKAIELKPDDAELRVERAKFYADRGEVAKATVDFN